MLKSLIDRGELFIVPGVFDGLSTRLAVAAGFEVLYMSGFSVAGSTYGQPDIGLLSATEMVDAARRVVDASDGRPVVADADTGYGGVNNIQRCVREYERAGVAGIQLEDQVHPKRCGHMERKQIVPRAEAVDRIRAAVDSRASAETMIIARTDARATDGLDEALDRAGMFLDAGADLLFVEAPATSGEIRRIARAFPNTPLVINLVEDGRTPWLHWQTLSQMGFIFALQPVTAVLHAAANLSQTYGAMITGFAPSTPRMSFSDFNSLVGVDEANRFSDSVSVPGND